MKNRGFGFGGIRSGSRIQESGAIKVEEEKI